MLSFSISLPYTTYPPPSKSIPSSKLANSSPSIDADDEGEVDVRERSSSNEGDEEGEPTPMDDDRDNEESTVPDENEPPP